MSIRNIFVFLTIIFSINAGAATLATENDVRKLTDKVMDSAGKGDILAAFDIMKPYVVIPESEFQSTALASKGQRDQVGARFGKSTGYEFISSKKVGESLIRFVYIEKTEKSALPWVFYFYKTPSGWALNTYAWSGQINQLFEMP